MNIINMTVVTRFAPSPTGMLHIGGARTAIFNYLFAKKHNGQFLLRIEDTDKERSTQESVDAIIQGLEWLGIKHDGDVVFQSKNIQTHIDAAKKMVEHGFAYYAYDTKEELETEKLQAEKLGKPYRYNPKWRDAKSFPSDINPVIRLKVPAGKTSFFDSVNGQMEFDNSELEDLVLLRSDGTPTYMLAVVVDDINMGITHVIRGNDHLSNTAKQVLIYQRLGAKIPSFCHIPLIHDVDGQKLSKRKNAVSTIEYKNMGYLPDAVFNYLLRLGWSYKDKEFFTRNEAIDCFDLNNIGKSPSRFDFDKLNFINLTYLQNTSNQEIFDYIKHVLPVLSDEQKNRIISILDDLKKSNTLNDIVKSCLTYVDLPTLSHEQQHEIVAFRNELNNFVEFLRQTDCNQDDFGEKIKNFFISNGLKMSEIGPIIRVCLIGTKHSAGLAKMIKSFGATESIFRIEKCLA